MVNLTFPNCSMVKETDGTIRSGSITVHMARVFLGGIKLTGNTALKWDEEPRLVGSDGDAAKQVRIVEAKDDPVTVTFNSPENAERFVKEMAKLRKGKSEGVKEVPATILQPEMTALAQTQRTPPDSDRKRKRGDPLDTYGQNKSTLAKTQIKVDRAIFSDKMVVTSGTNVPYTVRGRQHLRAPPRHTPGQMSALMARARPAQTSQAYSGHRQTENFGLRNLGNTCYLNAVTQAVRSLREFITSLQGVPKTFPMASAGKLFSRTLELVEEMGQTDSSRGPANPAKLREQIALSAPMFAGSEQQDAHEFLLEYVNQLHDELLDSRAKSINKVGGSSISVEGATDQEVEPTATDVHFHSEVQKTLECINCHKTRDVSEYFRDFSLDFYGTEGSRCNVEDMLRNYFDGELLDARCEHCSGAAARMSKQLVSAPRALMLHLKRFVPNFQQRRYEKRHQDVLCPAQINLSSCLRSTGGGGSTSSSSPQKSDITPRKSPTGKQVQPSTSLSGAAQRTPSPLGGRMPARPLAPQVSDEDPTLQAAMRESAQMHMSEEDQLQQALRISMMDTDMQEPQAIVDAEPEEAEQPITYSLRAVVAHTGSSPHCGHYVCYAKEKNGSWTLYDDSMASDRGKSFDVAQLGSRAYIACYVLDAPPSAAKT